MKLRIRPLKVGESYEPCMIEIQNLGYSSEFYPSAIVHVDTFHEGRRDNNTVYSLLIKGVTVTIDVPLVPL